MGSSEKRAGSELRDSVAGLLEIKFSTVRREERLAVTTADIFYIDDLSTFPQNIAVECKDWDSPLNSSDISNIYNLYQPSLSRGEIDKLLVIGRHELGMQPSETVKRLGDVRYQQFDQFVHSLMSFQLLLQNNIAAFDNHEASQNFIQPRVAGSNELLIDAVNKWLSEPKNPVSMVYGGYGVGKTSFSYYLSAMLTDRYRQGRFNRVPIRIPLGRLFTKQDLKALICSELTGAEGQPAVAHFTFDLFLQMVVSGSVFLILDGFDEMRHAMSMEDFAYTFEQMSVFFRGKSKAIILGRPDAFFDDQEETDVIDALLSNANIEGDNLRKFEVDLFCRNEVQMYIDRFIESKNLSREELNLINGLQDSEYEILSRPVQLSMFTKITRTYSRREYRTLTRYKLYEEFIKRFTTREEEKPARSLIAQGDNFQLGYDDPRSEFMQNLAWWISTSHRENRFLPSEVPVETLPRQLRVGDKRSKGLREALVGSIVEQTSKETETGVVGRKGANYYYFPHKSYIEFLVSQYFCRVSFSKEMYRTFFQFANPEMISFVKEGPNVGAENIVKGLQHVIGNVPREIIRIGALSSSLRNDAKNVNKMKASDPNRYLLYELFSALEEFKEVENLLLASVNNARVEKSISTAMRLTRDYLLRTKSEDFAERLVVNSLAGLPGVRIVKATRENWSASYKDGTYVRALILGKCVQRHKSLAWYFSPAALKEPEANYQPIGMRCEDYGQLSGHKAPTSLIKIDKHRIWERLSENSSLDFPKAEVRSYLQIT
ncbi:hypothetical protein [uncultured Roseobacter sp.]|uniref:NACHT domain-containing protein n=1 Tax=uncultured Roseobacter sp. TaxID=114847 RepID=UPI0026286EE4|nr:hypothetical protein [uncultured Roseobacter sp.]